MPLATGLLEIRKELVAAALELELADGTVIADTVDATSCVFLDGHAWMMLDPASFTALHEPSSPMAHGVVAEMCDLFTWSEFDKLTSFSTIMSSKSQTFCPSILFTIIIQALHASW